MKKPADKFPGFFVLFYSSKKDLAPYSSEKDLVPYSSKKDLAPGFLVVVLYGALPEYGDIAMHWVSCIETTE